MEGQAGKPADRRNAAAYRYGDELSPTSAQLVNLLKGSQFSELFEACYELLGIPVAIIDLNANVLSSSRWQQICTEFHRVDPRTCARCVASDVEIGTYLAAGHDIAIHPCENGLTDCAAPIIIGGEYVANLFIGQFFTASPDEARFRRQAAEFGFDEAAYLAAMRAVPVVDARRISAILTFLQHLTALATSLFLDRGHALAVQQRLSIILDAIPQAVFWKGADGRYLGCNAAFARMAGIASADEVVGKTDFDLAWTQAEAEGFRVADQEVMADGKARLHFREKLHRADGTLVVLDTSKIPLADAQGVTRGVVGICHDVTEDLRASDELKRSQELFRAAFRTGPDAFYIATLEEGRLIDANDEFASVFGYQRSEVIGRTSGELGLWANYSDRARIVQQLRESGFVRDFEAIGVKKGGQRFFASISIRVMSGGEAPQILGVVRDITELRRAQEEQQRLEAQLRHAQQMEAIGTLAAGFAHDFNNLLTPVLGGAQLALANLPDDSAVREEILGIEAAAMRAQDLVRQILLLSRTEHRAELEAVDLIAAVKETVRLVRSALPATIEIRTELPAACPSVLGNSIQLHQVLLNLCTNARDAMAAGGTLTVRVREADARDDAALWLPGGKAGAWVVLSVADTGCGMSEEVQRRIFDPYFTTKPRGKGTGLGLPVTHSIVTGMGGQVRVSSAPGEGSTFDLLLPTCDEAPRDQPVAHLLPRGAGERILVVDDEDAVRQVLVRILRSLDYNPSDTNDPVAALARLRTSPDAVDALLTDQTMPGMTGVELARACLALRPDLPIVLCTGFAEIDESDAALVRRILPKPFTMEDVAVAVHETISVTQAAVTGS